MCVPFFKQMTHHSVDILANIGAIFYRAAYSFVIFYKVLRERYYDDF